MRPLPRNGAYVNGAYVAAVLAVLVVLTGCSESKADQTTGGFVSANGAITVVEPAEREPAPDLAGEDLHGDQIALSDFGGRTVVVNVWASWCGPCRQEAPELGAAAKALKDDDVRFLGIAIRDEASSALAFNKRYDVPYPSINDPASRTLLGFRDSLPAIAVPTTYIIDDQGRVAVRILDKTTKSTLIGLVEDVQSGDVDAGDSTGGDPS